MEKESYGVKFALLIFGFIPFVIMWSIFSSDVSMEKEVNSEIVNGIITVSGLIFAFQPAIFRVKKKGFYRPLFLAIFSVEGILLGLIGYNFIMNALNLGYLSGYTLFLASGSLFFNISMSAYFVLTDLVIQTEEE